ncbi:MAG TPA: hypothetical protein VG820_00420 [Fimbriimonadaceae bacterium]|nr:hypothetical protein [Fimbriimonadaceae bacterium]
MGWGRGFVGLLLALLASVCPGRAVPAEHDQLTSSMNRKLAFFAEHDLPSGPNTKLPAFVYLRLSPGGIYMCGLAWPSKGASAFASACDEALSAAGFAGMTVRYGHEYGYEVATAERSLGFPGRGTGSASFDFAAFRNSLKRSGYPCEIVLGIPEYVSSSGIAGAAVSHLNFNYYPVEPSMGRVRVAESLDGKDCLNLAVYLASIVAVFLSNRRGRHGSSPRRRLTASAAINITAFLWLMGSGTEFRAVDLWLGIQNTGITAIAWALPCLFCVRSVLYWKPPPARSAA